MDTDNKTTANAKLEGTIRVVIPYSTAKTDFPTNVVSILNQLAASRASDKVKSAAPEQINWYYCYKQPPYPDTLDEASFVGQMASNTPFYLVATHSAWRGFSDLTGKTLPHKILTRYQQSAKIIIDEKTKTLKREMANDEATNGDRLPTSMNEDFAHLINELDRFGSSYGHRINVGFLELSKAALQQAYRDMAKREGEVEYA